MLAVIDQRDQSLEAAISKKRREKTAVASLKWRMPMSRLAEFRALEQQLAQQLAELENLKNDEGLKREVEFEEKLYKLLEEYGFTLKHIIAILDPDRAVGAKISGSATGAERRTRRARQLKRYKNPDSGEVVETKGGNHKVLKEWKAQYGAQMVESWLQ
jgi:mevalonate kinase